MVPHITALIKNRQQFLKYVQIARTHLQASQEDSLLPEPNRVMLVENSSPLLTCQMSKISTLGKLFALKPRETSVKV